MAIRDLVPWNSPGREVSGRRDEEPHPILRLHREMNRLFEDVFRGFDLSPFSMDRWNGTTSWPRIEISESEKEVQVTAELPGLEEKDIEVELANGVLAIRGEKKTETEDKNRSSANAKGMIRVSTFGPSIPVSNQRKVSRYGMGGSCKSPPFGCGAEACDQRCYRCPERG
jgi:HSP20 family molecular chaperone IbpA